MRHVVLLDDPIARERLFPFSLTRPIGDFRIGITTLAQKWAHYLDARVSFATEEYLCEKFPADITTGSFFIFSHLLPSAKLAKTIASLTSGQGLFAGDQLLAWTGDRATNINSLGRISFPETVQWLEYPFQIFGLNGSMICEDFAWLTQNRDSGKLSATNHVTAASSIFIEPGAQVEHCFLNASQGPIYIGKNAQVMEGAMIRGPFSMGNHSVVKMGATIYGATSFGPHCRMGGEIKNTVVFGYSNKAHGGYLGDAVLGEWCNLGANTNCSNLKNNVRKVKIWNEPGKVYVNAGTKCGLLMGDYSRSGISTMFNTGTVTGVSCNIFGGDFPPKYIPSFSWGGAARWMQYDLDKAVNDARAWQEMKQREMTRGEENILRSIYASYPFTLQDSVLT
jgi:UDP-N-acetylglucosamine diphosphorylase/glucosamine-1-phosphate N-acetyltransferase